MTTDIFTSPTFPLGVAPDINAACDLDLVSDASGVAQAVAPVQPVPTAMPAMPALARSPLAGSDIVPCGGVVVMRRRVAGALAVCRPSGPKHRNATSTIQRDHLDPGFI